MRSCSKCGSYIPDGKRFCVACGRPALTADTTYSQRIRQERMSTHTRITDAHNQVRREARTMPRGNHPYAGNTYEQHKSHDPSSKDYYRSKHDNRFAARDTATERALCVLAYVGIFFFLPLVVMPDSKVGRFHANQGLALFLFNIIATSLNVGLSVFGVFFMAYGIYNVARGECKELPWIGKLRLIKESNGPTSFGGRR